VEVFIIIVVIMKSFISRKSKLIINCFELADAVGLSCRMIVVVINRYIIIALEVNNSDKLGKDVKRCIAK